MHRLLNISTVNLYYRLKDNFKNMEVKLSLCLIGHRAVKSYGGAEEKNPLILTLTLGISA